MATKRKRVKAGTSKAEAKVAKPSKNEFGLTANQESFAQLVASGRSQADAYRAAYPSSQEWTLGALYEEASRTAALPAVSLRVKYLRALITQQAIDAAVVDKAWVLKRLKTVAERCLQAAPVLDRKGKPVVIEAPDGESEDGEPAFEAAVAFAFDPSGANRALELLGKEQGMFVDRKEIGEPGSFDKLDDDELSRAAAEADAIIAAASGSARDDRKDRDRGRTKATRAKT